MAILRSSLINWQLGLQETTMELTRYLLDHAAMIRILLLAVAIALFGIWETLAPLRMGRSEHKWSRVMHNLTLAFLNTVVVRLLVPGAGISVAYYGAIHNFGLFNHLAVPVYLSVAVSIVVLDLGTYWQHVVFHAFMPLWRLHRVHHTDCDLDFSSGMRFHPLEICLSLLYKGVVILLLGAPAVAVLLFETLLNILSLFNHANIAVSQRWEPKLRALIVTPKMHWVHHSTVAAESRRNFGFCLSVWDRLFGSYLAAPRAGYANETLGVEGFESRDTMRLLSLLRQPFSGTHVGEARYLGKP